MFLDKSYISYDVTCHYYKQTPSTKKRYLVPCNREDLKKGDIAFRTDNKNRDKSNLYFYCIINENKAYHIYGLGINVSTASYKYWYKVVKEEDL